MYTDIKSELKILKKRRFSGHLKIGIENGKIVNETLTASVRSNPVYSLSLNQRGGETEQLPCDK
jgi:hypothetical protein|nr:MAG TPA: hypothetical protein [Caudoviricetes sp.]